MWHSKSQNMKILISRVFKLGYMKISIRTIFEKITSRGFTPPPKDPNTLSARRFKFCLPPYQGQMFSGLCIKHMVWLSIHFCCCGFVTFLHLSEEQEVVEESSEWWSNQGSNPVHLEQIETTFGKSKSAFLRHNKANRYIPQLITKIYHLSKNCIISSWFRVNVDEKICGILRAGKIYQGYMS